MKAVRFLGPALAAALLAVVAASAGCGDGTAQGCNPACRADEMCTPEGRCVPIGGDADGSADDGATPDVLPDAAPDGEVVPDVVEDRPADETTPDVTDWTPETTSYNYGAACTDPSDCTAAGDPQCLTEMMIPGFGVITFPGGYCSATCTGYGPDSSCGPGAVCISGGGYSGCLKSCTADTAATDCRVDEGYSCFTMFGPPFCMPPIA